MIKKNKDCSMNNIELKPCPFCGEEAVMFDTGDYWDKPLYRVITKCSCCMQAKFYETPQKAAEHWNNRKIHERK